MIEVATDEGLTVITFDRPARRNALGWAALESLHEAVRSIETPVAYLTGAGSAFCAGADLSTVETLTELTARDFSRAGQRVARAIEDADAVVVAGIDGPARGGGVDLALACDLRVATPDATFAEPGVRLGIFGAWGGTIRLPRIVGLGNALDLSLSGRTVGADEALRMGLISRITADPKAVAMTLAEHPADALRTIKRRIRDDGDDGDQAAAEVSAFGRLIDTHAAAIGERRVTE